MSNSPTAAAGAAHYRMYIGGKWTDGAASAVIPVENPATEQVFATVPEGTPADAEAALRAARAAHPAWAALPPIERARFIHALAAEVLRNREHLARIVVQEVGKPLGQAQGEVDFTATFLTYAAEQARRIEGDILPSDNRNEEVWIRRVPYGAVVGLTAWNYPAALTTRKLGPALMAGNTIVLKPHEVTPLATLEIARMCETVGIPPGVVNVVTGAGRTVGDALVRSPMADLISMTGSVRAGKEIYAAAADQLKVIRLELGGKAPFIVMDDADLDAAVEGAIVSRFTNCGQVCTCNERMYLHEAVADKFLDAFLARVKALRVGDPMENPDIGPKITRPELDKVAEIVDAAVAGGARVLAGGKRLTEGQFARGHWFAPTVLATDDNSSDLMQREIFGPVVPVMRVRTFEDALRLANESSYGLSAFLYTRDLRRLMRLSSDLQFGEIYVNRPAGELVQAFHTGWRQSGLGGEDGKYGFDLYLRKKTTYVNWG